MTASPQFPIRVAEELVLLMLDERSGYLEMAPGWRFSCVMAGAVLADLALEHRIDTDLEALHLADGTPTGDDLLDPMLREIVAADDRADAQFWIERGARHADGIVAATLDRLVARKILSHRTGGFWGLSPSVSRSGTYPTADATVRRESKARILDVILNETIPSPRDAILVALMQVCGGFRLLLEPEDYEDRQERIEWIARLDLIGRTVATAVRSSALTPKTRSPLRRKPIPRIGWLDLLRQPAFRRGNIPRGLRNLHERFGPVVRAPFRIRGAPTVIVMGAEANHWVNRHGRFYLRTRDYIRNFEAVFGASRTMPGMDGAEHYRFRREMHSAYSRRALAERLPELIHHCRRSLARWKAGDSFGATDAFQRHISHQISHLMIGVDCSEYSRELIAFEHRALVTHVQGALPHFMLSTPRMRRARRRVHQLQRDILATHTAGQRKGKPPDLADTVLRLHRDDPQFLPETDLTFPFVASMVASIYLGSGVAFAVYAMARHPELRRRIRGEAEALFGGGREPQADEFDHRSMDVTVRFAMECARLYPVIPMQLRTVMNECEISGFRIPTGAMLLIGQTVPHYCEDLFPDPLGFDIDRYLPDRGEHLQPGAYAPFGLGTHMCLGHRWVELQMAVNLLLIAYHLDLAIEPGDYRLGINPFPTSAPGRKLRFRVADVVRPI